jgi:hypothetical protein
MTMGATTVWEMPHLSQEFIKGPRLRRGPGERLVIAYDFERESGGYDWEEFAFDGLIAYRFTEHRYCTAEQYDAYDELQEVSDSGWIDRMRDPPGYIKHYRIYFDDIGCYEVLARTFTPPAVDTRRGAGLHGSAPQYEGVVLQCSWRGATLEIDGRKVELEFPIAQAMVVRDVIVVLYDHGAQPGWIGVFENLIGVNADGQIIWTAGLPTDYTGDSYLEVAVEAGNLVASSWSGRRVVIDPESGRVVDVSQ